MPKYEKKRSFVYAEYYDGTSESIAKINSLIPEKVQLCEKSVLVIKTFEGNKIAYPGDFVIIGKNHNVFICNEKVFLSIYEIAP